jgi:hypothetical protein
MKRPDADAEYCRAETARSLNVAVNVLDVGE